MKQLAHDFLGFLWSAHTLVFVLAGLFHLWFWAREGFAVPRYIHVIAGVSGVLGLAIAVIGQSWWFPVLLWSIPYVAFVFYGGHATVAGLHESSMPRGERDEPYEP